MTENDKYIIGSITAGRPVELIAEKLGMTVAEIEERVATVQAEAKAHEANGMFHLINAFTNTCHQYEMVGEGLKHLSTNLSNPVTIADLVMVINGGCVTGEAIAQRILERYIVLQPYTPNEVEALEEEHLKSKGKN